ncbi:unnamed protein product [Boreogadus saida]
MFEVTAGQVLVFCWILMSATCITRAQAQGPFSAPRLRISMCKCFAREGLSSRRRLFSTEDNLLHVPTDDQSPSARPHVSLPFFT